MSQKYVPSNVFLKCDKGTTPCRLQVVRPRAKLYGEEQWATENDAVPNVNVTTFGVCSITQKACVPATVRWQNTLQSALKVMVQGAPESPLVNDSFLPCTVGGKIDIFFTQAAVAQALANDRQADAAHEVAQHAKDSSLLLFGAALLVGIAVVGLTVATGGAALPLLALAGEAALTGAAVGAGVGAVAGGVQGYADDPDGGWDGAAKGAGMGLLTGAAMGAAGGAAVAVGGTAAAGLMLASAGAMGVGAAADGYALYKQPTLRNGLVLVGDIVILAGGRLAHEAVKGAGYAKPTWVEFIDSVAEFKGGARPELARQAHDLFIENKWGELETLFNRNGINGGWPPNRGFISVKTTELPENTVFDRYGGYTDSKTGKFKDSGGFVAKEEVEFPNRALPESYKDPKVKPKHAYRVIKKITDVKEGEAIPWFGQPGKGTQYELPAGIDELIAGGYIERLP